MHFLLLLFYLAGIALGASGADNSIEFTAIEAIDVAVRNLTAMLNEYNGGINESDGVTTAILNVHAVNRAGFASIQASSEKMLDYAQSQAVVNVTRSTVGVSIPQSIAVSIAKKPLFDAALLTSLVEASLKLLQYDHDTFSLAVGQRLDPRTTVAAAAAAGAIAASIGEGTLVYAVPALPAPSSTTTTTTTT